MVTIVKDKDLIYDVKNYDVVLVGVNIMNTKGNGFQFQVHLNFPKVYEAHRDSNYADVKKIGTVSVVPGEPTFCLCYISKGRYRPDKVPDTVDYEGLENCLKLVAENFKDKRIASVLMGVSPYEGGGDRKRILDMFNRIFKDIDITIYDYEQTDYIKDMNKEYKENARKRKDNEITTEEYYNLKKNFLWRKHFGIYVPMPDGITYREVKQIIEKKKSGTKFA